ncbi:unnamed protein product [Durusdinium trenchii]|uniref:Glycosyl transferase CAP10 domain-containing protein n=2 Tax=Durusdinium trenchii TaxID=1381693 RepID=A0ABP0MXU1_9DINO
MAAMSRYCWLAAFVPATARSRHCGLRGPEICETAWSARHRERIWEFLEPVARSGPITYERVKEISQHFTKINGWPMYFAEVAILDGHLYLRHSIRLGGWLSATLKLLKAALESLGPEHFPDVFFVLSVHDEALLEKSRSKPLPLLSGLTTVAHWDIPVPGQTWFESSGGISSQTVLQDFALWESVDFQSSLEATYPWSERSQRGFFRGHDWGSGNAFTEFLASRPPESCIRSSDVSRSFGYRRWYAALAEGELAEWLDVGLTGAPDFVKKEHPKQRYVPPVSLPEHAKHKYLLHLDGTAASNRFLKLLLMGSVVLKQDSVYEEYFYKDLQPYVHFVPFARDRCSTANLTATLQWLRTHDADARAIARAGQRVAREELGRRGAMCYWQKMLASYAALQAFDPRLMLNISEWWEWT